MSTVVHPKGHRHTRSAALPPSAESLHHPQNPYHLSQQAEAHNPQSVMEYSTQATTPPRTPRRDNGQPPSRNKANSSAPEAGSKGKPRNKKPKNGVTSPAAISRNGCNTPATTGQSTGAPSSTKPINTPSTAAFAGPTFHASPAPSTLPIPSFYSKSVPDSPGIKGIKPRKEPSSPDSSSPPIPASNLQFHREESPLDIFFRADREEKARARSASSSQTAVTASGPFHPPSEVLRASQTPPASTNQRRLHHASKLSSSGMFAMELDVLPSPGTPYGPAFSTPYAERINAARSSQIPHVSSDPSIKGEATSTSEALKAYLFAERQQPSSAPSSANPFGGNGLSSSATATESGELRSSSLPFSGPRRNPASSFPQYTNYPGPQPSKTASAHPPKTSSRPSSGLRQEVTPTTTPTKTPDRNANNYANSTTPSRTYGHPSSDVNHFPGTYARGTASPLPASQYGASSGNNPGDLKNMEDSLRKILKLDSTGSSGASGQGIDRVPAAGVAVPSYVGGRAPPVNGMQNGVMGS